MRKAILKILEGRYIILLKKDGYNFHDILIIIKIGSVKSSVVKSVVGNQLVNYITSNNLYLCESKRRSILKTSTYRFILIIILAIITYVFTGDLFQTSGITIVFSIISTITYYLHERMWNKIQVK
jgi:uncharacterized membrane protein